MSAAATAAAAAAAAAAAMEVNAEARRILAVSISKLYASRTQRGGLRLHRSLLLSLVMRSARDIYHSSRESEAPAQPPTTPVEEVEEEEEKEVEVEVEQPMETGSSSVEQPEPQPEPIPEQKEEVEEEEEEGCDCDGEFTEDKENLSPTRQSRKRRGKASAAPDFLPSKRARLEPGEERYSCHRAGATESLTALSLNLNLNLNRAIIPAF